MHNLSYTLNHQIYVPEIEVKEKHHEHVYVPLRGYCACLAVYDIDDVCIGWIDSLTLGYPDVKSWMVGVNWVDTGY